MIGRGTGPGASFARAFVCVALLSALVLAISSATSPAEAACNESTVRCLYDGDFNGGTTTTTSPTFDIICSGVILNVAGASFDVPAGQFHFYVAEGGRIDLWLRDSFTITGPPPGSPITLHMRVRFHGGENWAGGCCPDSQARVQVSALEPQAGDPSPIWSFGRSGLPYDGFQLSDSLDLVLERVADSPIGIEIHASSLLTGPSSLNMLGEFEFLDLQPGWKVSSCKGYQQEQPVPAAGRSWGHVKSVYR